MSISQLRQHRLLGTIGLFFALALSHTTPALAAAGSSDTPVKGESASPEYLAQRTATSTGDTKLYLIGNQDSLTTSEGSSTENIKVTIPVAIHYVADTEGNLTGPSDNVVHFTNNTKNGSVHVSKIQVSDANNASITKLNNVGTSDDTIGLSVTPGTGSADEFGNYKTKGDPINKTEWDIAQKGGVLYLNNLAGKIGGFNSIDPATDTMIGGVHWTVRAGTRSQADIRDDTLTIHYNSNNGYNKDCKPVDDSVILVSTAAGTIASGGGVEAPKSKVNADGSVTTWIFEGWYTAATGGSKVSTAEQAITAAGGQASAGNSVLELYAHYTTQSA